MGSWLNLSRNVSSNVCICVSVCPCTFTGQAVGGDAWQSLPADVAEGRSGVRAGVPVVHPREMLHVELAGLGKEK